MLDIGKTDPIVLYDFAVLIDAAGAARLDPDSEIGKAYRVLLCMGPYSCQVPFSAQMPVLRPTNPMQSRRRNRQRR